MFPRKKQFNAPAAPAAKPAQSSGDWLNSLAKEHKRTPEGQAKEAKFQAWNDRNTWEANNRSRSEAASEKHAAKIRAEEARYPKPQPVSDWRNPGGSAGGGSGPDWKI